MSRSLLPALPRHRALRAVLAVVVLLLAVNAAGADVRASAASGTSALLMSGFLGFGTGLSYLGLDGRPFLVADLVGCAATSAGGILLYEVSTRYQQSGFFGTRIASVALLGAGGLTVLASRVWQVAATAAAVRNLRGQRTVVDIALAPRPTGCAVLLCATIGP